MKTRMLIAAAVATVAFGVNVASANDGWDLSRMTETGPAAPAMSKPTSIQYTAERPAQVSSAKSQVAYDWTFGNG